MLNIERGMSNVEVNRICEKVIFLLRNSKFPVHYSIFIFFLHPCEAFSGFCMRVKCYKARRVDDGIRTHDPLDHNQVL